MKYRNRLVALSIATTVFASAVLTTSAFATHKEHGPTCEHGADHMHNHSAPTQNGPKTREQVKAELKDAQRAGLHPIVDADYPPSQHTIDRNKARFEIMERHNEAKRLKAQDNKS